ncbi:enoyl-CoA hydratase/isomerase family protein [Herbaspirillum sp. alder98]|uniref:enoyl-CoA hydratase/isomerase family protein n=1 Tax=Herbaspirillum sp. alder98 TaxID=2913096 RepID=UPI001CD8F238|nr:enoyl-CoA hydratase/isomerase family protein [Herbaspirillum sp. alder98]MCA1324494.1 enoyl-CoA hydratase/isomerase family protein [Herbaspirillum sp. alder98]
MYPPVLFEELVAANGRRIGVATLASEKTLHAISLEMVNLLTPQLRAWQADPQVALVILQAQGEKAFCAGGDLQQLYRTMRDHHASPERGDIRANRYAAEFFEHEYRLDYLIHTFGKPILAWGHGIVMGGGIGLMAGCSHRVVTERSRLAMPEITIGLYPDVGGSWFLARMPGKTGLFLALTGANLNAADAVFANLADYRLVQASKPALIDTLLAQPWGQGDDAQLLDGVLLEAQRASEADGQTPFAPSNLRQHYDLVDRLCRQADLGAVVDAILAIDADDAWLQKAAATLRAGAPGSAALAYALQRKVRHMSLAQVFRLEFVVSLHCAARPDFVEGIRALIVEKDQKPKWQPATLAEATPSWVEGFFADPWPPAQHPLADLGA